MSQWRVGQRPTMDRSGVWRHGKSAGARSLKKLAFAWESLRLLPPLPARL